MEDLCYKTCEGVQQMTPDISIGGVIDSLDCRLSQMEKGVSCLNLARDLLFDWVYHNTIHRKDEKPKPPAEIDIAMQLIKLVISDLELNQNLIVDEQKELDRIVKMIQDKNEPG